MSTLNKVMLIGRLGKDAETKKVAGDKTVTEFSLATEEVWTGKEGEKKSETEWHECVLWGESGVLKFLTKGSLIYVEGRKKTEHFEDKGGVKQQRVKIVLDGNMVRLLDTKEKAG